LKIFNASNLGIDEHTFLHASDIILYPDLVLMLFIFSFKSKVYFIHVLLVNFNFCFISRFKNVAKLYNLVIN